MNMLHTRFTKIVGVSIISETTVRPNPYAQVSDLLGKSLPAQSNFFLGYILLNGISGRRGR